MTGIGIGVIVLSYSFVLYGYSLVKGYNIKYLDMWKPTLPKWPPDQLPSTQAFPEDRGKSKGTTA